MSENYTQSANPEIFAMYEAMLSAAKGLQSGHGSIDSTCGVVRVAWKDAQGRAYVDGAMRAYLEQLDLIKRQAEDMAVQLHSTTDTMRLGRESIYDTTLTPLMQQMMESPPATV